MLQTHKRDAFEEIFPKIRKNSDTADYLNLTNPRIGLDLTLYIEVELERQELREKVADLEGEIEQMEEYLAAKDIEGKLSDH